ncbi:hypothetical protein LCGC14_2642040 [marine sediment metagenome]|uniref:Uncharacterized protein n=1 Tax=marine sediment metagenome TaxID=412755 RepID=A0A0F8ZXE8_9ZZZZ
MIEVGLTYTDTDTSETVTIPLRDFAAKPLTAAKFDKLVLACYEDRDAEGTPGDNRMDDLRVVTESGYQLYRLLFRRWARPQTPVEDL